MRRSVYFLIPLIPLALTACEDGPNQTFAPATGTLFNNGNTCFINSVLQGVGDLFPLPVSVH